MLKNVTTLTIYFSLSSVILNHIVYKILGAVDMESGTKIAITAGALGAVVGLGMQAFNEQMIQTIGQGWMLGGVASVVMFGGVTLVSKKWEQFKAERETNNAITSLAETVDNSTTADAHCLNTFVALTQKAMSSFENSNDTRQVTVAYRLDCLGKGIVSKMPLATAAFSKEVVIRAMDATCFKLNVCFREDATREMMNNFTGPGLAVG